MSVTYSVLILSASVLLLPLSVVVLYLSWILRLFRQRHQPHVPPSERRTFLLNGASMSKSLALARKLHQCGHRIVITELEHHGGPLMAARFSNAVSAYYELPDPTTKGIHSYINRLVEICKTEKVHIFCPVSPVANTYHDALAATRLSEEKIQVFHPEPQFVHDVDLKYEFIQRCQKVELDDELKDIIRYPETHLIKSPQQVLDFKFEKQYILKRSNWIPDDTRHMVVFGPDTSKEKMLKELGALVIGPEDPFVLQEFLKGEEYANYGFTLNGNLRAFCACPSSTILYEYREVKLDAAEKFTKAFVKTFNLTGHIAFDFIQAEDHLYPIECNPRTHTAICLFRDHPYLAEAYVPTKLSESLVPALEFPLKPLQDPFNRTYWFGDVLYDLIRSKGDFVSFWKKLRGGHDGIYDVMDPLPFFCFYHGQLPWLVLYYLRHRKNWSSVNVSTCKLWK